MSLSLQRIRKIRRIAMVGDYLPRHCGIATFTTDLSEALAKEFPGVDVFAVPVNDKVEGYAYPPRVRLEISQDDLSSYERVADYLNFNHVDMVCIQHEYGIYGGKAGSYILALAEELRMPIVTTLHTVLETPDENQKRVLEKLAKLSERLVVMTQKGAELLKEVYNVSKEKIVVIAHGTPDVPFVDPGFYKDRFGVEGRTVVLTFGLLSPNKGIEYVIEALPNILKEFPQLVYIILGATHPHVVKNDGESYRLSLERLAEELGVSDNIIFHNRFIDIAELIEFIAAADIYVTPYLTREQISSGTLTYALAAGKSIVSTPYWYAEELLADNRGQLVPFKNSNALSETITRLLGDENERHAMRKKAYLYGREMIWPKVAMRYMEEFKTVFENRQSQIKTFSAPTLRQRGVEIPQLRLTYLERLTDSTGILQHGIFNVPNYWEGYTTDDNARALHLTALLEELGEGHSARVDELASTYLAFLWFAFHRESKRFRNFMSYDRKWLEEVGSEDSHGRSIYALGAVASHCRDKEKVHLAQRLFSDAISSVTNFTSPRAMAFAMLGVHEYSKKFPEDRPPRIVSEALLSRLLIQYQHVSSQGWRWFEESLSYSNAAIPHAIISIGQDLARQDAIEMGIESLSWLIDVQTAKEGHFAPVGSSGLYMRGKENSRFDQQPIEAHATVAACLEAYRMTSNTQWYRESQKAYDWFLGRNDLRTPMFDAATGGCRDGLHPSRVNQNMGAESTLSFLLASVELRIVGQRLNLAQRETQVRS